VGVFENVAAHLSGGVQHRHLAGLRQQHIHLADTGAGIVENDGRVGDLQGARNIVGMHREAHQVQRLLVHPDGPFHRDEIAGICDLQMPPAGQQRNPVVPSDNAAANLRHSVAARLAFLLTAKRERSVVLDEESLDEAAEQPGRGQPAHTEGKRTVFAKIGLARRCVHFVVARIEHLQTKHVDGFEHVLAPGALCRRCAVSRHV
jgi:hypothetical protein